METPNLVNYYTGYRNFSWDEAKNNLSWLPNAKFNIADNVLDKHQTTAVASRTALIWVNEEGIEKQFTFNQIYRLSCKMANLLKSLEIKKGERVFFFLPRVPEVYYGFLGALRIGAVPGTLFPAFGTRALLERLKNSGAKILITDRSLLERLGPIRKELPELQHVLLVENLQDALRDMSAECPCEPMDQRDPAYMLYTSATGNTPVCGIVAPHSAIIQQYFTAKWVLDLHEDDIYWCTADLGWVTGIAYGILSPWSLGITQIAFAGRFDAAKWFHLLEKYKVSVWYTAPTALRMLAANEEKAKNHDFAKLRHICSVGEPLNPSSITWAVKVFGIPVHDTWWQTETGAMMITNFPSLEIKPGSMGKPVPGVKPAILDDNLKEVGEGQEGNLAFEVGWPSMMIDVWKNPEHYKRYFSKDKKWFISGDRAFKDKDGYFWFVGRADDIIKTSGERVGPFEVESSLSEHPAVMEAGVIGKPDKLRGQIIKAFVVLNKGFKPSKQLIAELQQHVKNKLAGHAYPREIEFINKLPKNRSGKIVRRLLKATVHLEGEQILTRS